MRKLLHILLFISLPFIAVSQNLKGDDLKIKEKSRLIGQVTIGSKSFDASALLTLTATDRGLLIPRLTTAERDAISSPATGLMVYNTTTGAFDFFDGSWGAVGGGGAVVDSSFVTLQTDTNKAFNNTNIQFADSVFFQNPVQIDSPFTVNLAQSTFKGIDATSSNFAIDVTDNVDTKLFRVRNDGSIAIGLSTPTALLHAQLSTSGGSFLAKFEGDNGSVKSLMVLDNGNVGVGKVPLVRLDVSSSTNDIAKFFNGSVLGVKIRQFSSIGGEITIFNIGGTTAGVFLSGDGTTTNYINNGTDFAIGTTASSGGAKLTIDASGTGGIRIIKSATARVDLRPGTTGGELALVAGGVNEVFLTASGGGVNNFINNGLDLGIGLIAPTARLHIRDDVASTVSILQIHNDRNAVTSSSILSFSLDNSVGAEIIYACVAGDISDNTDGAEDGDLKFKVTESGTLSEKMTLFSDGTLNVDVDMAIGTNNPDAAAILELQSITKGFLITRMTATQGSAITAVNGLMIYVNSTNGTFTSIGFWGFEGGSWIKL